MTPSPHADRDASEEPRDLSGYLDAIVESAREARSNLPEFVFTAMDVDDLTAAARPEPFWPTGAAEQARQHAQATHTPMVAKRRVDALDLDNQRRTGWRDFHPEDYCHRCGNPNLSWWVDSDVWNEVMRPDGPDSPWLWDEIICPQCFTELAGGGAWRLVPDVGTRWDRTEGTSRPGSVRASEAQVEAAMEAMDCALQAGRDARYCAEHHVGWLYDANACSRAERIADAVVAAGPDADEVTRLARAVASVTPCSCSAQRSRAESAEAEAERHRIAARDFARSLGEAEADRDRLAAKVARVEALFSGGPDTPCRTAWREVAGTNVECVEVPLDDLRAALSGPSPATTPEPPHAPAGRDESMSGQSGEGEAQGGAEKRCRCCTAGWYGSRWHSPPYSEHCHCECGTPCRACAVGDGFHRSSPHRPAEHNACGCQETDR